MKEKPVKKSRLTKFNLKEDLRIPATPENPLRVIVGGKGVLMREIPKRNQKIQFF